MSCPWFCCCLQCCCPKEKSSRGKYPHIIYKAPERVVTRTPEFSTVPLEKIFGFQQPQTVWVAHPQISAADGREITTIQPMSMQEGLPHPKRYFTHPSFDECPLPSAGSIVSQPTSLPHMRYSTETTKPYSLQQRPSYSGYNISSGSAPSYPEGLPILEQSLLSPEEALTSATLCFSVYFDVQRSTLNIQLLNARNLDTLLPAESPPKAEASSLCVVLYLEPSKEEVFQAKLVPNTPNPEFNERFTFTNQTVENVRKESIVFHIYQGTKPSKKSNKIGFVMQQLSGFDLFGVITTVKIESSSLRRRSGGSQGRVLVSLKYDPVSQTIQGTVIKATNLKKQDVLGLAGYDKDGFEYPRPHAGFPAFSAAKYRARLCVLGGRRVLTTACDPYVKVYLVHKGVRQGKWMSRVKRHTLSPVFNESFQFDVSQNYIQDLCLEFVMMEYERFSRNDPVGVFFIGEHTVTESGRLHWNETLSSPQAVVSRWHSLLPTH